MEDQPISMSYFCFSPGEIFIELLCLSPLFFSLTFIWWLHGIDFYPPVCCLCEQLISQGAGKRQMEGPIFPSRRVSHSSLEGGFLCSPLSFFFGQEQREYVGTNASGSVWLVRLEDTEQTSSLQPTESIHQQKTSPH